MHHFGGLLHQRWECFAERLNDRRNQLEHEWFARTQVLVTSANSAAQDAAQDIVATFTARCRAISNRDGNASHMVSNHAIGDIGGAFQGSCVGLGTGDLGGEIKDWREQISVVVAALVLQHAHQSFQSHAGIDVARWKRHQFATWLTIELNEHQVPHFKHIRVAAIDQACGVASADAVVMNLGAGAARAGLAHLPEIVFHAARDHVVRGQKLQPQIATLFVGRHRLLGIAGTPRGIESIWVKSVHLGEQLNSPTDCLFLEVITKRPVAEHFKECVVVGIAAHILKVVVLAAGTNALLSIHRARVVARALAEEYILELVHPRVGEEQGGILKWDRRARWHNGVTGLLLKERDEGAADIGGIAGGRVHGRRSVGTGLAAFVPHRGVAVRADPGRRLTTCTLHADPLSAAIGR